MALSREKKSTVIEEISQLLAESKLTVMAYYTGTPVKAMQSLRKQAQADGTQIKIVKNRLFKKALSSNEKLKNIETAAIKGQLLYVFNLSDEIAPAKNLADFAKAGHPIEFMGGLTADGQLLTADEVKHLAALPSKQQLRSQLIAILGAPLSGIVNVAIGNLKNLAQVVAARADQLNASH